MTSELLSRRSFLKGAAVTAIAATALKAGHAADASGVVGESKHHWVMVIDQAKCVGCEQCTKACRAHNDVSPSISWNKVIPAGKVGDKEVFLPRPCMHCDHAPCV
jgi:Na+-translocating ferredoxin:NAD+ oxidoreductase RNF subunit RnfB